MTATVMTKRWDESMIMTAGDDPSFDAFLAFLHDDNATGVGKAEDITTAALPIVTIRQSNDHPSERLPSHQHSPVKNNHQSVHRPSSQQYPTPPHISNIDRPSIINRRQSTRSSNGEKTTIVHNNTTTTTIIDATTRAKVLQKGGGGGGTTNNNSTIMQNGRLGVDTSKSPNSMKHNNNIIVSHSSHINNNGGGGGSSPRRSFMAPVIIELDDKWSEHHNVLRQGLHQGRIGGNNNNKTKGTKNKKGGFLSRFDRMFHPPVASTSKILENYNINIKDDEEILSIGLSSITSNGSSKRSIHSTLLDPFFAKLTPSSRSSKRNNNNNMETMKQHTVHHFEEDQMTCSPAIIDSERMDALSPSSLLHPTNSNEEYSLQYSSLSIEDNTSELAIGSSTNNKRIIFPTTTTTTEKGATAKCNNNIHRELTTNDNNIIRDDLIELFLRGGKEKVDSQLHNSFDDTVVIRGGRGGGEERTKFDEEEDRRRRKPKRSDGREHQLIFI
jgi:hypothetical protein